MLAIIIPCYNEEIRFPVTEFELFLNQQNNEEVKYFLINDCSTDNTLEVLQNLTNKWNEIVYVLDNKKNLGKAETVRQAILSIHEQYGAVFDWYAYLDADFATHPIELLKFYTRVKNSSNLMAMGARWQHLGAKIERKTSRHYLGRIFATAASMLLKLKVYDTQCGAKLISSKIVKEIFNDPFISKWIFDVEIIARMINIYGLQRVKNEIIEIPLEKWKEVGDSKIKLIDMIKVPYELIKIKRKYFS